MRPARRSTTNGQKRFPRFPIKVLLILILVGTIFGLYFLFKPESNQASTAASIEIKAEVVEVETVESVKLVFKPPYVHNDVQEANLHMVVEIIQDPTSWGLRDKAPVDLTGNALQVFLSTLETENHFYHYDSDGKVALSYSGCCVGIGQVHSETTVCQSGELLDIRRNAWCAAKIFSNYYDEYRIKAPELALKLAVARYKGAVLLDGNGMMELDQAGLPIIPPDDPTDPADLFSQVNRVFVDPETGESMFFVSN